MILLTLNRQLNQEDLAPEDRAAIIEKIREIEILIGLD